MAIAFYSVKHQFLIRQINKELCLVEAECRSVVSTCYEVTWLKNILTKLRVNHTKRVTLFCNNQAAIHIALNPLFQK